MLYGILLGCPTHPQNFDLPLLPVLVPRPSSSGGSTGFSRVFAWKVDSTSCFKLKS